MKFATLAGALTLFVGSNTAFAAPRVDIVYGTVFYHEGEPKWEDLPVNRTFSASILASLPQTSGSFVMIGLRCEGLSVRGKLTKCRATSEPKSDLWMNVGKRMAKEMMVERPFSRRASARVKFVGIQVRVSNSEEPVTDGPCWPPTCHFVPAPPPPERETGSK